MAVEKDLFSRRIGTGGAKEPLDVVTHGHKRWEFDATSPAIQGEAATASPDAPTAAGTGKFFFRNNGAGKSQFCVRFPSGAVQIVATEP